MAEKKTSWGAVANWYDELLEDSADSYQKNVILPNLNRIIEPKKGIVIVDIACGQGFFSRAFAQNGAEVIGCDISSELIDIAKKNSPKEIEFFVAPADNLQFQGRTPSPKGKNANRPMIGFADFAVIVLALQNIENLAGTISECSNILKPGGKLVIVLNHPTFRIPKFSSWQWDEKKTSPVPGAIPTNKTATVDDVEYRRIDAYMSDQRFEIDMTPGEKDIKNKKTTVSFHRPLQLYFKTLAKSGFAVTRLEEWISHKKSQAGPRMSEEDRLRKEIPMFLCLEAQKGNKQ